MKHLPFLAVLALAGCGGDQAGAPTPARTAGLLAASRAQAAGPVTVPGYRFEYALARGADGDIVLTRLADGAATTYRDPAVAFAFVDRVVSFDAEGLAGKAYRLYQAAFDRKPDQAGLGFWIGLLSGGFTLGQMAQEFVRSDEFQSRYGNLDDRAFVALVYQNVLHRAPDEAGFDYWLGNMRGGLSRTELLNYFSESAENKKNVAADIAAGIAYLPDLADAPAVSPPMFRQPVQYTAVAPSPEAVLAAGQLFGPATPRQAAYPEVDSASRSIVIPALRTEAGVIGPVLMRILEDGTLAPAGMAGPATQEASASYDSATGLLRMDLLDIGPHHYADATWHLEKNGSFRLVSLRAPVFSDYVELIPDVFVGGKVDSHYSLVTSIQQLEAGAAGDLLMLGNSYWDFSLQGLDRYRKGPQHLLKWDGRRFADVSGALVAGGLPAMYQVESEKMLGDFNGDGRLDVILGGNGPDTAGNTGEPSHALISTGATGYLTRQLPNNAGLPGHYSWVHGGAAVRLRGRSAPVAFIGDYTFGPSYLVEFAKDGTPAKLEGGLPAFVGQGSSAMNHYFKSADFPVTAALGADLDGDGVDELVLGSLYSYSAALVAPELNRIQTMVLKQDANGGFAGSLPLALPDGPFAKRDCYQKPDCTSLTVKQIAAADINRDGRPDLLVTHHAYGPEPGSATQLLINLGKLQFEDRTEQWFGSRLQFSGLSHIHSYPADLNADGCPDVVLRGDEINGAPVRVFVSDCKGRMSDYSAPFQRLMEPGSKYMHGGVPVVLGGRPALLLFNMMGSAARLSVVRFKYPLPTPAAG